MRQSSVLERTADSLGLSGVGWGCVEVYPVAVSSTWLAWRMTIDLFVLLERESRGVTWWVSLQRQIRVRVVGPLSPAPWLRSVNMRVKFWGSGMTPTVPWYWDVDHPMGCSTPG